VDYEQGNLRIVDDNPDSHASGSSVEDERPSYSQVTKSGAVPSSVKDQLDALMVLNASRDTTKKPLTTEKKVRSSHVFTAEEHNFSAAVCD
jgi:hypothetical protein